MSKTAGKIAWDFRVQADDYALKANLYHPDYPAHQAYQDMARRYQQLADAIDNGLFDRLDAENVEIFERHQANIAHDTERQDDPDWDECPDQFYESEPVGLASTPLAVAFGAAASAERRSHEHCPGCPDCTGYADPNEPDDEDDEPTMAEAILAEQTRRAEVVKGYLR